MRHAHVRHRSRTTARTGVGLLAATAMVGTGALIAAPPVAAAQEWSDSWISAPEEGLHQFRVPDAAARAAAGTAPAMVAVAGNFGPGKSWAQLNTAPAGETWDGLIGPFEPGLYYYQYEATVAGSEQVIGFGNPDSPAAVTSKPTWNTFFVAGPEVQWMADVPSGGEVQEISYDSTVTAAERSAVVWTPPGYDADRAEPYPVLYLLNDEDQSHREWVELGRAPQILDNLAVEGDLEPMVVVMADANTDDARVEILDNIVPAAQHGFNVSAEPSGRAIAGIGRGGLQALNLLLTDTGEFSHVGSLSGSLTSSVSAAKAEQINAATELIRLYVGNTTDPSYNQNVNLVNRLDTAGVDYQFDGVTPETGGTWETWRTGLHDLAPRLFQDVEDHGPSEGHLALDGPHSLPPAGTTPTPWIDENGIVTFETGTEFADATNVTIWANWAPTGNWLRVPMEKHGDRWRLTLGPLDGGSYYYKFVVDRVDHKDTANPTNVLSEPTWSTFYVPGEGPRADYTADVATESRGTVEVMTYTSITDEQERFANVWTPPDYDADRAEPYPVLYLQHGGGQSWADWIDVGFAAQILDNHYLRGTIVPMVVVMADGNDVDFPVELRQRVVPTAEAEYNVSSEPAERALAGLSMGSGHALETLYAHPGEFAYIGAFSSRTTPSGEVDVAAINAGTELLRLYTGDVQDFTYEGTLHLSDVLSDLGIDHEFASVIPGPHSWDVWQKSLIDFLPRLFSSDTSDGIPIDATIPEIDDGVLVLSVADYGEAVSLSAPDNRGDRLRLTGALPEITVSDSRTAQQAGLGGWTVTGQADSFSSGGRYITADHLGWLPTVTTPRAGVAAGETVVGVLDGGPGLATPATLGSAESEGRVGSTTLGGDLVLDIPVDTPAGTYTGNLHVSLFPVD